MNAVTTNEAIASPAHQKIVLFPALGYRDDSRRVWRVEVRGAVYEADEVALRRKLLIRLLRRTMKLPAEALASEIKAARIVPFVSRTVRDRQVSVSVPASATAVTCATNGSGQFGGSLAVGFDEAGELLPMAEVAVSGLPLEARLCDTTGTTDSSTSRAHLIEPTGISVISDIDDTIKHTDVVDRAQLLNNTFLREFRAIEGMTQLYQAWAGQGAQFHYVSASPWQLYEPLAELLAQQAFPAGTYHLRSFRLRQAMLRQMLIFRRPGKYARIKSLVAQFPQRQFVLVGDSGEYDMEIYGAIARRFPRQIPAIFIRDLATAPLFRDRQSRAMRDVRPDVFRGFRQADELPRPLPGVLEKSA